MAQQMNYLFQHDWKRWYVFFFILIYVQVSFVIYEVKHNGLNKKISTYEKNSNKVKVPGQ
jgi:hypothetical protein